MTKQYTFVSWVLLGAPIMLTTTVAAAAVLHISGLRWEQLAIPTVAALAIELTLYLTMFWIRRRYPTDFRPGMIAAGAGGFAMTSLGIHYGGQWGWLEAESLIGDYIWCFVTVAVATVICVIVFTFIKPNV